MLKHGFSGFRGSIVALCLFVPFFLAIMRAHLPFLPSLSSPIFAFPSLICNHGLLRRMMLNVCPVIPLVGDCTARKTAAGTTCSGSFHGSLAARKLSACSHPGLESSVFTGPGIRTFTIMPSCQTSSAIACVSPCNADLVAQYMLLFACPTSPMPEPTLMMFPRRWHCISSRTE